jgi:hypothetical protein
MLFLASFILKGHSQAALVVATMAILGLLLPPAAWISAAGIVLVTLVYGTQRGLLTMALSLVGTAIFAALIFSVPQVAIVFVLFAWLPAWMAAMVLRQTVSLAYSLQILTAVCLFAVVLIYILYPNFGELWREPLDLMVKQLAEQSDKFNLAELKQKEDWVIKFLPGLFASSILFGTMLSLFLGRWWQAVFYNPGGFAEEFQGLDLGKVSALVAIALVLIAMVLNNVFAYALLAVVAVLYLTQALALLHGVFSKRKINRVWLYFVYFVTFFIPQMMLLLIIAAVVDPWLNIRQRMQDD